MRRCPHRKFAKITASRVWPHGTEIIALLRLVKAGTHQTPFYLKRCDTGAVRLKRPSSAGVSPKAFGRELMARIHKGGTIYALPSGERTELVKKVLRTMARRRGLDFSPGGHSVSEFLCDFTWLRLRGPQPSRLQSVALAVECEWGSASEVFHDLQKLLPLKARFKLCMYRVKTGAWVSTADKIREGIGAAIEAYQDHLRGEHYLLLELNQKRRRIRIYHLPVHGRRTTGKFRLLCQSDE
jgi:hypothetical protein